MRRKDRQINDIDKIEQIISNSQILRLGLYDDGYPYIVPLHFGYEINDSKIVFYMHSAKEGHKLDLIKNNSTACIELDNNIKIVSGGEVPCKYSSTFASVIAWGKVEILNDEEDKIHGLKVLMKHQTGRDFDIDVKMAQTVNVLRFLTDEFSAKANNVPVKKLIN